VALLTKIIDTPIVRSAYQITPVDYTGAVVEFLGIVRNSENGEPIAAIDYEVFKEMAEHQLDLLARKYNARFGLHDLICIHRVGYIPAGEISLFIQISSSHRAEAFEAIQGFINELKETVPIWKHPVS